MAEKDKFADEKLNDEQLDQVAGGTFTANKYREDVYNDAGIKTNYHFIEEDEFFAKDKNGNWQPITYEQANAAAGRYWDAKANRRERPTFSYDEIMGMTVR